MNNDISLSDVQYAKNVTILCDLCNRPVALVNGIRHLECRAIGGNAIIQGLEIISEWLTKKKITHVETVIEHIDRKLESYKLEVARIQCTQERVGSREL